MKPRRKQSVLEQIARGLIFAVVLIFIITQCSNAGQKSKDDQREQELSDGAGAACKEAWMRVDVATTDDTGFSIHTIKGHDAWKKRVSLGYTYSDGTGAQGLCTSTYHYYKEGYDGGVWEVDVSIFSNASHSAGKDEVVHILRNDVGLPKEY